MKADGSVVSWGAGTTGTPTDAGYIAINGVTPDNACGRLPIVDSDGDGIPDNVEGTGDVDNDGIPNDRDTDSDGDGISDAIEAGSDPTNPVDTDGDGTPDYLDTDSDNDGVSDADEVAAGSDPRDANSVPSLFTEFNTGGGDYSCAFNNRVDNNPHGGFFLSSQYPNDGAYAALKADGSITTWGSSSSGGTGGPTDAGYVSVASNRSSFAAMKADGSITAWGSASNGGSGAPTDNGYCLLYTSPSPRD